MAMADYSQLDRASYDVLNAAGSGSSLSSPSSSSSSSSDGHSGFFKSRSRQESPSTTPLCFGAGGGVRGSRGRAPAKHQQEEEAAAIMAPEFKGDVVDGRYLLRKISKGLKKARSDDGKRAPSSSMAAVDDTARERAEAVARAISYCKDTLRRGAARSRPRRAAVWPLGMQTAMAKRFKEESPCPASPSRDGGSLAATAVAHGEESPRHCGCCRGSSMSSLDDMEFLKTFDGDEEMINHHFITVEI